MRSPVRSVRSGRALGGLVGLAVIGAALLTACGAARGSQPSASSSSAAASATPGAPNGRKPLNTPPTNQRVVVARDQDNGHAVALQVGDHLQGVLGSTYWTLDGSSDPNVLRPGAPPPGAP